MPTNIGEVFALIKRYASISCSAIVLVASGSMYVIHLDSVDTVEAEYSKLSRDQVNLFNDVKNGNGLDEELAALNEGLGRVDERLFVSKDLAKNYSYFYQIESKTKVKLSDLRQYSDVAAAGSDDKKGGDSVSTFSRIGYEVKVEGKFDQILDFLKNLEGGESFYRLNNFVLKGSTRLDPDLIEMQISFWMLGKKA